MMPVKSRTVCADTVSNLNRALHVVAVDQGDTPEGGPHRKAQRHGLEVQIELEDLNQTKPKRKRTKMKTQESKQWGWLASGIALGLVFLLAVVVIKPIGVSTQFVILDGIVMDAIAPDTVVEDAQAKTGYASPNEYLNRSGGKYAKNVANPLNYSFIFVLAMVAGGVIAALSQRKTASDEDGATLAAESGLDGEIDERLTTPAIRSSIGNSATKRHAMAFAGGLLALFGARLAGGCTSGHMMSGMMQTSLSGYLFAIAAFATAVPTAMLVYKK